jgi:hypothetical protein
MLKRTLVLAGVAIAAAAGVMPPASPAAAHEEPPPITYSPKVEGRNIIDSCRLSDNVLVVQAGPETFELDVYTLAACVSTLARGTLSFIAYRENCKVLEPDFALANASGRPYPYSFYGNPDYTADNRFECVHFLRGFHTGELVPGPGA